MNSEQSVLSVTDFTRSVKQVLESRFRSVAVVGEISNFLKHASGHLYFTIKDAGAQLSCVMFRGNAASVYFLPRNGMEVICRGNISVYEPRGNYQLLVTSMQPRGEGALQAAFEALKRRLQEEGLFDQVRKRPLPRFPATIALLSSPTGAVLHDLRSVIHRRDPSVTLVVSPIQVQGVGAVDSIIQGLERVNRFGGVDVIILARGGGSIEDLWPFNEESVARAIAASAIPVISAVGHESDVTIADFVADVRAATPSVAGELVVGDRLEKLDLLRQVSNTAWKFVDSRRQTALSELSHILQRREFGAIEHLIRYWNQHLDDIITSLHGAMEGGIKESTHALDLLASRLQGHDPQRILRRGYAIVRKNNSAVQSSLALQENDRCAIAFHDGSLDAEILSTHHDEAKTPHL